MRSLTLSFAVAAMLCIAPQTRAEYACSVTYLSPSYLGTGGALSVTETAGPDCTGASITRVICSAGATHLLCGKTVNFTAAAMQGHYEALTAAVLHDQWLTFALGACVSGVANNCVLGVMFHNPPG